MMMPLPVAIRKARIKPRKRTPTRAKLSRPKRNRGGQPFNPFPPSSPPPPPPPPSSSSPDSPDDLPSNTHLAIGDPNNPKHFSNRLARRTESEAEAKEVLQRLHHTAKVNNLGEKMKRGQTLGVVTHRLPEGERQQENGTPADRLVTIVQHMQHPDWDNRDGPVATTMMDAEKGRPLEDSISHMIDLTDNPAARPVVRTAYGDFLKNEPMDIAWQMLKHAKSKEALANKKKYDTNYHDTPDRVKYRVDLKRERRQRGVYGKGGKDMSHTKDGKLTPEDPSANRGRQSKAKGTLK